MDNYVSNYCKTCGAFAVPGTVFCQKCGAVIVISAQASNTFTGNYTQNKGTQKYNAGGKICLAIVSLILFAFSVVILIIGVDNISAPSNSDEKSTFSYFFDSETS